MISKLLEGAINFVVYGAAATMMAAVIMTCYLWSTWHIDRGRLIQMLAIAQGLDLFQAEAETTSEDSEISTEQPSMQQIINARLSKDRDLTMREMALQKGNEQLRVELRRVVQQTEAYDRLKQDFETRLAHLKEGAQADGRAVVGLTLQTLEPDQAKLFLLEMLEKEETEDVVLLLTSMDERRRGGIIEAFQTPDEIAKIAEVLRLIRQGYPEAAMADEVSQKVNPNNLGTK